MSRRRELVDLPDNVVVSPPQILAKAYRDYNRYCATLQSADHLPIAQERDVLIAGKVVVVLPIDIARQEIIMIRPFRLPAHLANGCGDLVEFVAGRVETGESLTAAATREGRGKIGVFPARAVVLVSVLITARLT